MRAPPSPPFSVELWFENEPRPLIVDEVLRFLPGKRLVVRGQFDGRVVLAKLFFGAMAKRYMKRERDGIERLTTAGVPTPTLIGVGALETGGHALVLEYLEDTCVLTQERLFQKGLLDTLVRMIAKLHQHGVQQTDIHLRNFLVAGNTDGHAADQDDQAATHEAKETLHLIDGDGVRRLPDRHTDALTNLAWFAAEIDPHHPVEDRMYRTYVVERGWSVDARELENFSARVATARRVRLDRYVKKTLRNCTQFSRRTVAGRLVIVERGHESPDFDRIIADPNTAIANGEILKAGNTATVARVDMGSTSVILKRYNVKNTLHGLKLLLRKSRARRTWQNGHRLLFQGVPTARPLALIEGRRGATAYVVLEDLRGKDLAAVAANGVDQGLIEAVGDLFHRLARAYVFHGDTKATNFIVREGAVYLIDLDALTTAGAREHERDIDRFLENWHEDSFGDLQNRFRVALRAVSGDVPV